MRHIAIINDSAEVVTMVGALVTPGGRRFLKLIGSTGETIGRVKDFQPDLIIIPLHRRNESLNRPVDDYRQDILGATLLELVSAEPAFAHIPVVLLGFATEEADMPTEYRVGIRYSDFLAFPEGLQEMNPLVSAYIGPAAQGTAP